MNRYERLTAKAATGDRKAARALILGGWWPENWDADNLECQNRVIEGSTRYIESENKS